MVSYLHSHQVTYPFRTLFMLLTPRVDPNCMATELFFSRAAGCARAMRSLCALLVSPLQTSVMLILRSFSACVNSSAQKTAWKLTISRFEDLSPSQDMKNRNCHLLEGRFSLAFTQRGEMKKRNDAYSGIRSRGRCVERSPSTSKPYARALREEST